MRLQCCKLKLRQTCPTHNTNDVKARCCCCSASLLLARQISLVCHPSWQPASCQPSITAALQTGPTARLESFETQQLAGNAGSNTKHLMLLSLARSHLGLAQHTLKTDMPQLSSAQEARLEDGLAAKQHLPSSSTSSGASTGADCPHHEFTP
jgi:hypothetical protein